MDTTTTAEIESLPLSEDTLAPAELTVFTARLSTEGEPTDTQEVFAMLMRPYTDFRPWASVNFYNSITIAQISGLLE